MSRALGILCIAMLTACSSSSPHAAPGAAPDAAPAPSGISWAQFEDPAEHAFTVQVPRGWKVAGGLYRFGTLDPRIMVDMISPDGRTDLRAGDANVPPYATLSPTMRNLGWREGHPYSPNGVAREVVANYRTGWVFADLYGQARFGPSCQSLKLKQMKQDPPIHPNPNGKVTAGDVLYSCQTPSGTKAAYVFAETSLTQIQSIGMWGVTWLYSFIAPEAEAPNAMKAILHTVGSVEVSQQWEAQQLRLNGAAANTAMKTYNENMAREHERFERQSAQFESQQESFSRIIRGVDLTTDTVDGTQREVWMGNGSTHWINPQGDVVTQPLSPGSQYRRQRTEP